MQIYYFRDIIDNLLRRFNLTITWIGLDDIEQEGTWKDGVPATQNNNM